MSTQTEHRGGRLSLWARVPVVIFAGFGATFYWGLFNGDERLPSTLIGRPVPEFTLPPIEGRSVTGAALPPRRRVSG